MINFSDVKKIGVFAPSSFVEKADIEAACALMEGKGFEVYVHPQTYARHGQIAGTLAEKLEAINALYTDPSIDVIWAAGGGNRALGLIDHLDYSLIKDTPKPMVGFSDVTALLNAITVHTGITNIHGPVFKTLPKHAQLDALLAGDFSMPLGGAHVLRAGTAEGPLFGGNLSVFQYLPGTLPSFLKGAILFLEDCNEEISRIDKMLIQLKRLGVFDEIGGLLLGQFGDAPETGRPFEFSLPDIVAEHLDGRDIPVILNAPFGHGDKLYALPVGGKATLDTTQPALILSAE